ncbi:MAG TPA: SdiA-regulated domain-containing protein [Terricaulis sp.]|nr:SdiA-regulated domain-containing protein [Terricaulis sp.]
MNKRAALALALFAFACAPAPSAPAAPPPEGSLFAGEAAQQWRLPIQLAEISGLAVSPDGRLFAHDDERAVIYELDAAEGRIVKQFALGEPIETGDFEGLAISPDGAFHLITSRGRIYTFREGADGAQVPYETADSGMREICEIEGLAYLAADQSLIIACKRMRDRAMRDNVSLYKWRPGAPAAPWISIPEADLATRAGVKDFRPSSVEIDPVSGRILLLSGNDGALAELSPEGEVLAVRGLGAGHAQAEGVTIAADGSLIISDEAAGGQAMLSRYARAP